MHKVRPDQKNPHYKTIKCAHVTTWVIANDLKSAEEKAVENIINDGWTVSEVEANARETTLQDCPSPEAAATFRKAQLYGVSAIFAATAVDAAGGNAPLN